MVVSKDSRSPRNKFLIAGIILTALGALMSIFLPVLFTDLIKSQVKLTRDGEMFKNWLNFPVPLSSKFHFFNVLNPEEAMSGAKVIVQEVGPFTFQQWRRKEVIEWGPNDETIKYNEYKKYIYQPELSADWDQEITTVNPIVAGLASNLEDTLRTVPLMPKLLSPLAYSIITGVLMAHGHSLFLKTTPRQLLLGHKINIFETASKIVEPLAVFKIEKEDLLPSEDLPNNAFGILNGKNNTPFGPLEIYTGIRDASKYSYISSFKSEKKWKKWPSETCNRIYGTDGAQFPPFRSKSEKLPIFAPDLCRTLYLVYEKEDEFKGIPVWRMKLDPKLFEPPKVNPDNECYCMHLKKKPERCSIRGTIDLGGCLNGAPIIVSAPHFLHTQPNLADLVEGLTPSKKKHEFKMYFEPRLGSPVFAYARIQLSVRVERTSYLRGFDQVRNAFIPLVWLEESGGVDDFLATILKVILVYIIDGSQTLAKLLIFIGLVLLFVWSYFKFKESNSRNSREHLYKERDQSFTHLPASDSDLEESDIERGKGSKSKKVKATSQFGKNLQQESAKGAIARSKGETNWTPVYKKANKQHEQEQHRHRQQQQPQPQQPPRQPQHTHQHQHRKPSSPAQDLTSDTKKVEV